MDMKKLLIGLSLGLAALCSTVQAHGPNKAEHGGIVQEAGDLSFELVPQGDAAAIYVVDHGKPADASTMSGKLTVLNGSTKSEAALKPAGGNRLDAAARLGSGAKAVATVKTSAGKTITVRFAVK
jgi:hypothetical protein